MSRKKGEGSGLNRGGDGVLENVVGGGDEIWRESAGARVDQLLGRKRNMAKQLETTWRRAM